MPLACMTFGMGGICCEHRICCERIPSAMFLPTRTKTHPTKSNRRVRHPPHLPRRELLKKENLKFSSEEQSIRTDFAGFDQGIGVGRMLNWAIPVAGSESLHQLSARRKKQRNNALANCRRDIIVEFNETANGLEHLQIKQSAFLDLEFFVNIVSKIIFSNYDKNVRVRSLNPLV